MRKKRTYLKVLNEIIDNIKNVNDSQWKELFSISKNFYHFKDGYIFSRGDYPKWEKKFFKKMIETASKPSQWFSVARSSKQYSPEWNSAVEKLLQDAARAGNVKYKWENIRLILPKDHPSRCAVQANISSIRRMRSRKI